MILTPKRVEEFWSRTQRAESGCLEWIGQLDPKGYGKFNVPKMGLVTAHRIAFHLAHGRFATPHTDHICRNRKCVEVSHLRDATPL